MPASTLTWTGAVNTNGDNTGNLTPVQALADGDSVIFTLPTGANRMTGNALPTHALNALTMDGTYAAAYPAALLNLGLSTYHLITLQPASGSAMGLTGGGLIDRLVVNSGNIAYLDFNAMTIGDLDFGGNGVGAMDIGIVAYGTGVTITNSAIIRTGANLWVVTAPNLTMAAGTISSGGTYGNTTLDGTGVSVKGGTFTSRIVVNATPAAFDNTVGNVDLSGCVIIANSNLTLTKGGGQTFTIDANTVIYKKHPGITVTQAGTPYTGGTGTIPVRNATYSVFEEVEI